MANRKAARFPYLGAVVLLVLLVSSAAILMSFSSPPRIARSAFGFDGLTALLNASGIESRNFHGGGSLNPEGIGLRILPLFDDDTDELNNIFGLDAADRYLRSEIQPIFNADISTKIETLPTLVVLAKWRDGIRQAGFIHPDFLLPSQTPESAEPAVAERESGNAYTPPVDTTEDDDWDVEGFAGDGDIIELVPESEADEARRVKPARDAGTDDSGQDYAPPVFGQFLRQANETPGPLENVPLAPHLAGHAALYAPQYAVAPHGCEALIGSAGRGLLFECISNDVTYWVLSDPDLLNNHGLARGGNALRAIELIEGFAGDGTVLIDYTNRFWLRPDLTEYGRSLSDLLRYFAPPFRWLWLAGLGFLVILLWRGGVRGAPLLRLFSEGHGARRRVSLEAQARLMRRARSDGALLKTLLATHLAALAERLLGRDVPRQDRESRVLRRLEHRDPGTADSLREAIAEVRNLPDTASPDQTIPALSRLETAYKKALKLT